MKPAYQFMNVFWFCAARAGEAGKGFAVVANEIKELARQTAVATVNIKDRINEIQSATSTTVIDIGNISQASQGIAEVNENVAQSTTVIADITREIAEIDQQSNQAAESSSQVHLNAEGLADLAAQLETLMKIFKV